MQVKGVNGHPKRRVNTISPVGHKNFVRLNRTTCNRIFRRMDMNRYESAWIIIISNETTLDL